MINKFKQIAENAFGDIEDIDGFIDESEKTMLAITRDRNAGEFVDVKITGASTWHLRGELDEKNI